jgi:hypothetical protein
MHKLFPLATLLAACQTPHVAFSLPAEAAALQLGPQAGTDLRPRVFLANRVEEATIAELAPFSGTHFAFTGDVSEARCAQRATPHLVEGRPDAILVAPGRPEVTGVSNSFFVNPWVPMTVTTFSTANVGTKAVGYAMRAMPVSLPFAYSPTSGIVLDVFDRDAVAGGLIEGDVLTSIDAASACPPKDWPTWEFYSRMLQRSPGAVVEVSWVRAGTGKMTGTVRLAEPKRPHLKVTDSVDISYMPLMSVETSKEGLEIWRMSFKAWEPGQDWTGQDTPHPRR